MRIIQVFFKKAPNSGIFLILTLQLIYCSLMGHQKWSHWKSSQQDIITPSVMDWPPRTQTSLLKQCGIILREGTKTSKHAQSHNVPHEVFLKTS